MEVLLHWDEELNKISLTRSNLLNQLILETALTHVKDAFAGRCAQYNYGTSGWKNEQHPVNPIWDFPVEGGTYTSIQQMISSQVESE